jgi:hypothetical protein
MGKGGGGGSPPPNQQVTTTTSNLPEYARPYFENLMQRGQAESYRQYQPYEAERLAGFTPGQVAAQQETLGMQTPGQFGAATGLAGAGGLSSLGAGQQFFGMAQDPSTVQAFMSPYQQSVTDVARKAAIRDAQIAQQQINLGAVRQGTYGGARQALAQSERERGLLDRLAGIQAEGSQKAFEDARRTQQFGSDLGLRGVGQGIQAGQTLGQLGQAQQQADLQRLTAQETVGGQQRGFEQQRLDQQYADFLRQRDYPLEQLGYFSNLLRGVPVGLSSTQTTSAPPPSIASQIGGLGLAGLGIAGAARTAGFAEGGEVSSYAMGGATASPEELDSMTNRLSDQQLQMQLRNAVPGTPAHLMVAGELQARKTIRKEKANVPQANTTPVIADLLTGGAMPQMPQQTPPEMQQQMQQQIAMLPENAGGVAALPAPNMDNMEPYTAAAGGMVAFDDGGSVARFTNGGTPFFAEGNRPLQTTAGLSRRQYTQEELDEFRRRKEMGLLSGVKEFVLDPVQKFLTSGSGRQDLQRGMSQSFTSEPVSGSLPADVRRADSSEMASVVAPPTTPSTTAPAAPAPPAGPDAAKPTVRLKEDDALAGLTAIKPPSYSDAMALGKQFAGDTKNIEKQLTELPTAEKSATEEFDLYKKMGVDLDPYKAYKEQLQKEKSEEGKARAQAGFMRLAEFGFNWASQTGPTLQAAAKAGKEVSPGLMSDYKELNKLSRERSKTLADINATDSKMRKDVTDAGIAKLAKRRERLEGRLDQITDNAARISGTIYGQQVVSQTQMATTGMTTRATIANLEKQLSETEINNIVKTATDMLTKDQKYPFMSQEDKDTRLAELITVVNKARTAAGITVKPK